MGSPISWERDWPAAALALAGLLLAAPLWCVTTPAMPDYPAHLASYWLIGGAAAKAFVLRWGFIPNLAFETLVPALAPLFGLGAATKFLLTIAVLLWVLGPGAIHRALYGRWGLAPLPGAVFACNANFTWGFFNYYFASGLAFVLFAAWIACGRKTPVRLCGFALAVTLLYFCHIFAAAALLLMIVVYEITLDYRQNGFSIRGLPPRALTVAIVFAPAALAFLLLRPAGSGNADVEFDLVETMLDRFESLIEYHFDAPAYVLPVLLLGGLAAAIYRGRARLHPAMHGVLAVMLAGSLLAPEWAMGGWAVHLRLPGMFAALLFAAAGFEIEPRARRLLAAASLAVIAALAAGLAANWRIYDRQAAEFRAAESAIPRGARLVTVLDGDAIGLGSDQPYWHLAEFAIIDRGASTALMFATPGQHVVQLRQPYARFAAATAEQGSPPDIDELPDLAAGIVGNDQDIRDIFPYLLRFQCHYDQALVIHLGGPRSPVPGMLKLAHAGSFFSLYNIVPQGCEKA